MWGVYFEVAAEAMVPQTWIFTFGYGHHDPRSGESLARCYCRVWGTYLSAREDMIEMFGVKWSHQYPSEDDAGMDRFFMREVSLTSRWGRYEKRLAIR